MKGISAVVITYGFLMWLGGMIGYAKAHSLVSLVLGSSAAALLVVSGFTMWRGAILGYWGAILVTGLLTLLFCYRLYVTHKLMPAGIFAILSFLVLVLLFAAMPWWLKR